MNEHLCKTLEVSRRVQLCKGSDTIRMGERAFPIPKQVFTANPDTAYVEFRLSHAFPVVTSDQTGIHANVVGRSYKSLFGKVFNFNHVMHSYDPAEHPNDMILGTVMSVEFPETPSGGWKVKASREDAPGIRAVATMHKAASLAPQILHSWLVDGGRNPWSNTWTVSMEQHYPVEVMQGMEVPVTSGFAIRGQDGVEKWKESTPDDLKGLGYTYVAATEAPLELLQCFSVRASKVVTNFRAQETVLLFGGLDGEITYFGTGLTPVGKESEAMVMAMLASGVSWSDLDGVMRGRALLPEFKALMATVGMKVS